MTLHDAKPAHVEPPEMPAEVVVKFRGQTHHIQYHPGDTLLETMLRGGLPAPFVCAQGLCGTCIVRRLKGEVTLRENHVLTQRDLDDGYTLACQGLPTSTVCEIELEEAASR